MPFAAKERAYVHGCPGTAYPVARVRGASSEPTPAPDTTRAVRLRDQHGPRADFHLTTTRTHEAPDRL